MLTKLWRAVTAWRKSQPRVLFLHVRKVGGTSLVRFIADRFPGGATLENAHWPQRWKEDFRRYDFVAGHFGPEAAARFGPGAVLITCLRAPIERTLSTFSFYQAHDAARFRELADLDMPNEEIRERVGACERMAALGLEGFLRDEPTLARAYLGNMMTRQLAGLRPVSEVEPGAAELERAKRLLLSCDVVGLTHRLPEMAWLLSRRMGWASGAVPRVNVTPRRRKADELDPWTRERLAELTRVDAELYAFGVELFERRLREAGTPGPDAPLDADARLLPRADAFTFEQPFHGRGWYWREKDAVGCYAWTGPERDAWIDLAAPPAPAGRLVCGIRHAASADILGGTRLTVNGEPVAHSFAAAGPETHLVADVPPPCLRLRGDRVRVGVHVPAVHRPDAGGADPRVLGVAVSRVQIHHRAA